MNYVLTAARWTAYLLGAAMASVLAACVVVIVMFGGGDHFDPLAQILQGKPLFTGILMMVIGLVIGPKWEIVGGLLTLGGWAFLRVVTGDFPPAPYSWLILAVGLLYLGCGWWKGRQLPDGRLPERD